MPFGETIKRGDAQVTFDRGSIKVPSPVPLTVDHGSGVFDRIGVLSRHHETDDGLYAELDFADTQAAREARALMAVGAVTDVSAGVAIDFNEKDTKGVTHWGGDLDHVSVVVRGAFGQSGKGSKVLAIHSAEEVDQVETDTAPVADDTRIEALEVQLEEQRKLITAMSLPGAVEEPNPQEFTDLKDFVLTLAAAQKGTPEALARIEKFVLADDTTTTSAGVVPDYLSQRVIEVVDNSRPYLNTILRDPIGSWGMSAVYPEVTQGPVVDVQATEKSEVASQEMTIVPRTVDLVTYAGASDVSRQLIERSAPSFVNILFRHYASKYAQKTDGDAVSAGVAGAGGTAVLADLGNDAAATFAAVNAANAAIIAGVRKPASHWALGATRWTQLNSLVDADGRPLLVYGPNNPQNAQGQSDFTATVAQYHGLVAYLDVNAGATDALIYNAEEFAFYMEQAPIQLRAEVVSLLGFDMGVYGLFAHEVEHADAGYTLTAA